MSNVADGQRTGYGLTKLRDRYIRRAVFLSGDPAFVAQVQQYRDEWNGRFPRYPLGAGMLDQSLPFPAHLARDLADDFAARDRLEEKYSATLERPRDLDHDPEYDAYFHELHRLMDRYRDSVDAEMQWTKWVSELSKTYFPDRDFYDPLPNEAWPPEYRFLAMALAKDPRTIDDHCGLFPELRISIRGADDETFMISGLFLPLYPGMAAQDLIQAAPQIVDTVNTYYADQTIPARMVELRAEGLTHKQVADQLGLHEKTVASALKHHDKLAPRSS